MAVAPVERAPSPPGRASSFLAEQLRVLAVRALGIFVAVAWSQFLGSLFEVATEDEAQAGRIATTSAVCATSYALAAFSLYVYAGRGDVDGVIVVLVSVGELVAVSFRDLAEECVGVLDAEVHANTGHMVRAAEADFATALAIFALGVGIILGLSHARAPRTSPLLHAALTSVEMDAFGFCAGWALNDACYHAILRNTRAEANVWACFVYCLLMLQLGQAAILRVGLALHRLPLGSATLDVLEHLHGHAWAFVLGLALAYWLGELHAADETRHRRFGSAALATALGIGVAWHAARRLRRAERAVFPSLEALVRAQPHVRWPPLQIDGEQPGVWRVRARRGDGAAARAPAAEGSRGGGMRALARMPSSLGELRAHASELAGRVHSKLLLADDADAGSAYALVDESLGEALAKVRAAPPGAVLCFEIAERGGAGDGAARREETSGGARGAGEHDTPGALTPLGPGGGGAAAPRASRALVLVRTPAGPGDVLVVPVLRRAGGWTAWEQQERAVRAELLGLGMSFVVGWSWEEAFDRLIEHAHAERPARAVLVRGLFALSSLAAFGALCRLTRWYRAAACAHFMPGVRHAVEAAAEPGSEHGGGGSTGRVSSRHARTQPHAHDTELVMGGMRYARMHDDDGGEGGGEGGGASDAAADASDAAAATHAAPRQLLKPPPAGREAGSARSHEPDRAARSVRSPSSVSTRDGSHDGGDDDREEEEEEAEEGAQEAHPAGRGSGRAAAREQPRPPAGPHAAERPPIIAADCFGRTAARPPTRDESAAMNTAALARARRAPAERARPGHAEDLLDARRSQVSAEVDPEEGRPAQRLPAASPGGAVGAAATAAARAGSCARLPRPLRPGAPAGPLHPGRPAGEALASPPRPPPLKSAASDLAYRSLFGGDEAEHDDDPSSPRPPPLKNARSDLAYHSLFGGAEDQEDSPPLKPRGAAVGQAREQSYAAFGRAHGPSSAVEGLSPTAERGIAAFFAVRASGANGAPLRTGGAEVDVQLKRAADAPGSAGAPPEVSVVDTADGSYLCTFVPERVGAHELHVRVEGEHVRGSPFRVSVVVP